MVRVFFKILQQLIHVNLSSYFFRIDSIVLICITRSLLALYFMHEIRETSDVRFMPEIFVDKCLTLNSMDINVKHTHGHSFKLFKRHSNICARSSFFSKYVVNVGNLLPHDTNFNSVVGIKRSIAKVDFTGFLKVDYMSS